MARDRDLSDSQIRAFSLLLLAACGPQGAQSPPAAQPTPASKVAVVGTSAPGVRSVAVGRAHSCAVLGDGSVRCWGANNFGQLGDGSQRTRPTPVRVLGLPPARSVHAADDHTCAITEAGDVYCWGLVYGEWPELERAQGFSKGPEHVAGLTNVVELALGNVYAASLDRDGQILHWGGETRSMAPDRELSQRRSPTASHLTGRYRHVTIGRSLLCAATDSSVACAKLYASKDDDLDYDCLGKAKGEPDCQPFVLGFEKPESIAIAQLDPTSVDHDPFRDDAVCAAGADGSFGCARRVREEAPTEGGRWTRFELLAMPPIRMTRGSLALGREGELFQIAFGLDAACSADGCKARRLPLDALMRGRSQVALGVSHSCVARDADVVCWGENAQGQLGNGSRKPTPEPQTAKLDAAELPSEMVDIRANYAALRARLPRKKLAGFGLVLANAELFETANAQKSMGRLASLDDSLMLDQGEPRYLVEISEDRGERVGVRLVPSAKAERHCAGRLPLPAVALRGFVERDALVPVVAKRTRIAFDDDWVELLPGTPVYIGAEGRSALVFGERVPIDVPDSALGLSYTLGRQRKLDNEGPLALTVGGQIFKKLAGNFATADEGVEREDGSVERQRVSDSCSNAIARNVTFGTLAEPVTEEREWGYGWVDPGVTGYYPSGKRAGEVGDILHLRADKLTSRRARKCFRAIGEVELCFDNARVNEQRGD